MISMRAANNESHPKVIKVDKKLKFKMRQHSPLGVQGIVVLTP